MAKSVVVILATLLFLQFISTQFICSENFCSDYLEKNECIWTGSACTIQNSTYNGEIFSGEVPCGCCDVCLQNLLEGDYCSLGSPDIPAPQFICGPGLYCQKTFEEIEEYKCQKMTHSDCFKEMAIFEQNKNNRRFTLPPKCDGDGEYSSVKCSIDSTCFCVNSRGERIFGEAIYNSTVPFHQMNCECSRMHDNLQKSTWFKYPFLAARCLDDGSFDPLQCTDDGKCVCVETESGAPKRKISDVTDSGYNEFDCFNRSIHFSEKYFHDCEQLMANLIKEINSNVKENFELLDFEVPKCQPDGWFAPVQNNETHRICVDKYNQQIDDFAVQLNSFAANQMNCKCARTLHLLKRRQHNSANILQCQQNGNYEKIQCRGNKSIGEQFCYCADEDGLQISGEILDGMLNDVC